MINVALSEKAFMAQVVKLAELHHWLRYHTFDARRSSPGFPDLVLVRDGCVLFVELKTEKGKTTFAQDVWLKALHEAGATVACWRPSDWNKIVAVLTKER